MRRLSSLGAGIDTTNAPNYRQVDAKFSDCHVAYIAGVVWINTGEL